jgi:microcin C transport system substrate-binding protein
MQGTPALLDNFQNFPYTNPAAPKGGSIKIGVAGTFNSLNDWIIKGDPPAGLDLTTDRLMARNWDEPFGLYPLVAQSVAMPASRDWIEFTLDPRARFHDGTPITVADVLFTFHALLASGPPVTRRVYGEVAEAAQTGPASLRFTLKPGHDRETPLIIAIMPVFSAADWAGKDFSRTTLTAPLGSGPYRVAAVEPGRSITYERVKNYWAADLPSRKGQFNFDTIRYDYYRDDGVALEAFKAYAVDYRREFDPARFATGYDFPALASGQAKAEILPNRKPAPFRGLVFNTRRPLFADRAVRQALELAFDWQTADRTLFHNAYQQLDSYFANSELAARGMPSDTELSLLSSPRGLTTGPRAATALPADKVLGPVVKPRDDSFNISSDVPPEALGPAWQPPATPGTGPAGARANLQQADALLTKAGWIVRDGQRVNAATGAPFAFEILLVDPADERLMLQYKASLATLGIVASVRTGDQAQYTGRLDDFAYDAIIHRYAASLSPGNEQAIYWGSAAAAVKGSRNYAGIKSPAIDRLATLIGSATDRPELVAEVHALDRLLSWGFYAIPLGYAPGDMVAYWQPLQHPEYMPAYGVQLDAWWMAQ